jgi:hypothetical protein
LAKPTKIYAAAGCGTPVVFSGTGEGAALGSGNGLGEAACYDVDSVAGAMRRVLDAQHNGDDDGSRDARAGWVERHASLANSGQHAAAAVLAVAQSGR